MSPVGSSISKQGLETGVWFPLHLRTQRRLNSRARTSDSWESSRGVTSVSWTAPTSGVPLGSDQRFSYPKT
eukprot:1276220-Pyramimonas_sp.AAC.1